MTDRPIAFSPPMIEALLAGRKTQTRRILKPQPVENAGMNCQRLTFFRRNGQPAGNVAVSDPFAAVFTPYDIGDRLWVRENWSLVPRTAYARSDGVQQTVCPNDPDDAAIYRAGFDRSMGGIRWRSSRFMPRWASRLTLTVTDVRIEQLQAITCDDAIAEGAIDDDWLEWREDVRGIGMPSGSRIEDERDVFANLWRSLHGSDSWEANPWVVALSFTVQRGNIDG